MISISDSDARKILRLLTSLVTQQTENNLRALNDRRVAAQMIKKLNKKANGQDNSKHWKYRHWLL